LSIIFGIVALFGKTAVLAESALSTKILVAIKSVAFYLQKIFVPHGFSIIYPYIKPITILSPDFFIPVLIVAVLILTLFVLGLRESMHKGSLFSRICFFGLAWYFITLLPSTFNLIKGGEVFFASDRYAYIPMIGILYAVVWILLRVLRAHVRERHQRTVVWGLTMLILVVLSSLSLRQSLVWAKTEDLFVNVLTFYPESHSAHNNLANAYRRRGQVDQAIAEFQKAIAIKPHPKTYDNLGATYRKKGMFTEAINAHQEAMKLDPKNPEPHFGLGVVYAEQGNIRQAFAEYDRALELNPSYSDAYVNRGVLKLARGDYEGAVADYRKAIAVNPYYGYPHYNLAVALSEHGDHEQARKEYEEAVRVQPTLIVARINLGILYAKIGKLPEAREQFEEILELDPSNTTAQKALSQLNAVLAPS
jgi:tetratricopeptide (TPR) repeat protein